MDFQDRVGIITGGASGIGRAVAAGWAARGGMAIVADYDAKRGAQAAADLVSEGGRATFVECDLRDGDSIINVVETVSREFGRIDFLHNNGFARWNGPDAASFLDGVGDAQWNHVINVGITSAFRMARAVLPIMKAQGAGAIVNTSSTAAYHAEPCISAYAVAKAGISQLTKMIAVEFGASGIRSNAVCPGVIETPLIEGAPLDEGFMKGIPMGRLGQPEEIGNVVLFLASDLASYVNGSIVIVDGGRTV